jgi:hypothetical protein
MSAGIDAYGEAAMKYHDEKNLDACHDYGEEAIPERDPAYRLPPGTDYESRTIEAVSAEIRADMARRLQELGMSRSRAALVASL